MKNRTKDAMVQGICMILCVIIISPILYAVSVSFMKEKDVLSIPVNILPPKPTWENYVRVFTRTPVLQYMINSLVLSFIICTSRIIIGCMAAYAFAFCEFKGKHILFALTLSTMMIPPDVLVIQNYITISKMGLINTYLGMCSIFLVSTSNIFLIRQNFLSFSMSLKEAAYIDGCGSIRFFTKILLPTSRPILITVLLSNFVSAWNQYVWPMLVTNVNKMRTLQVGVTMLKERESTTFGPVMAGAVITLLPTVLLFLLFQPRIVAGMMNGAVKE